MSTLPVDEEARRLVRVIVRRVMETLPVEVPTLSAARFGLFEASIETLPVEVVIPRLVTLIEEEMTTSTLEPREEPDTASAPVLGSVVFVTVAEPRDSKNPGKKRKDPDCLPYVRFKRRFGLLTKETFTLPNDSEIDRDMDFTAL